MSLKGRVVIEKKKGRKIDSVKGEARSLKGRIHKLPKTAFWQRMSGWPLIQREEVQ